MSSYSCVTARLTMRSVLHTQRDSRSRSGPVIGLVPRPSMALMLLAMPATRKRTICMHIYNDLREPSVWNPHSVGRRPKEQKVRDILLRVTATRGDHDAARQDPCSRRTVRRGASRPGVQRGSRWARQHIGHSTGRLLSDHLRAAPEPIPSYTVVLGAQLFG